MNNKKIIPMTVVALLSLGINSVVGTIPVYATPTETSIMSSDEINEVEATIQKYDNQIETSMDKLNTLNAKIKKNEEDLVQSEKDIKVAEEEYENAQQKYVKNLRHVYKTGGATNRLFSYVDTLLSSKNINDVIVRLDMMKKILEDENEIINEIQEKKTILEEKKAKMEDDKEELKNDKDTVQKELEEMEAKKKELQDILEEQRIAVAKLRSSSIQTPIPISAEASETAKGILTEAQKYLGIPYVWGGTTPSGFDCSGLVQYVYAKAGVSLPRVSQSQQNVGVTVPYEYAKPGDLVFFGYPAYHVGIYMGNGQMLHAPQTGDVIKISPLSGNGISSIQRVIN